MAPIVVQSSYGSEIGSEHSHLMFRRNKAPARDSPPKFRADWGWEVSGFQERGSLKAWLGFWQSPLLESSAFMDLGPAHFLLPLKSRGNPGVHVWYLDFHSVTQNFLTPYLESNSLMFTVAALSKLDFGHKQERLQFGKSAPHRTNIPTQSHKPPNFWCLSVMFKLVNYVCYSLHLRFL